MQIRSDEELAKATPVDLCNEHAKAAYVAKQYKEYADKIKAIMLRGAFGYEGPHQFVKGTKAVFLPNNMQLKAVFILDHKLLVRGDELDDRIKQVERLDGGVLAESLFKYNTEIAGKVYQDLHPTHKARTILDPIVEVKSRVQKLTYEPIPDKTK